jgi:hypothetical protein
LSTGNVSRRLPGFSGLSRKIVPADIAGWSENLAIFTVMNYYKDIGRFFSIFHV